MKDVDETEDEDADHVEGEGDEEHEEVPVVPPPDAVVDPGNDSCDSLYDSLVTAYQYTTPQSPLVPPLRS